MHKLTSIKSCSDRSKNGHDMDELKWHSLNNLLRPNLKLVKERANRAREAYAERLDMGEDDLAQTFLLLDCAFVIVTLWLWKMGAAASALRSQALLRSGMRLLENQLPFFLLQALFDSAFPEQRGELASRAVELFGAFAGLATANSFIISFAFSILASCS